MVNIKITEGRERSEGTINVPHVAGNKYSRLILKNDPDKYEILKKLPYVPLEDIKIIILKLHANISSIYTFEDFILLYFMFQ